MSNAVFDAVTVYGEPRSPSQPVMVQAGPVRFVLEDGMIKHVRLGDVELVRRVYFGVRTDDWDTIYPVFSDLETERSGDTFRASWRARCTRGHVDYAWTGELETSADGTIRWTVNGVPKTDFGSNRIGLCLLLPASSLAGLPFTLTKADGTEEAGPFTRYICPELVGASFRAIRYQPPGGPTVECGMEGAIFDMEDQRLYMDTTYKAYAPLPHKYPHVRAGETFSQTFTLRFPDGTGSVAPVVSDQPVVIRVGDVIPGARIPGLGLTLNDPQLSDEETADLESLGLSHVRVVLNLSDSNLERQVETMLPAAGSIAPSLLISVCGLAEATLDRLPPIIRRLEKAGLETVMLEACDADAALLDRILEAGRSDQLCVLIGGPGSEDVSGHPNLPVWATAGADFLCWAASPAIHQEDDETLMENTVGIAEQLTAARRHAGRVPLAMGPFRLDGCWPRPRPTARHTGLFAAAWVASAVKHLAEGGARFATLFHTTGAAGVLYRPESFEQPGFDGIGRRRYPVYDCLWWLCRARGFIKESLSSSRLEVESLAIVPEGSRSRPTVLLINKTCRTRGVRMEGLSGVFGMRRYTAQAGQGICEGGCGELIGMLDPGRSDTSPLELPPYSLSWLAPS